MNAADKATTFAVPARTRGNTVFRIIIDVASVTEAVTDKNATRALSVDGTNALPRKATRSASWIARRVPEFLYSCRCTDHYFAMNFTTTL